MNSPHFPSNPHQPESLAFPPRNNHRSDNQPKKNDLPPVTREIPQPMHANTPPIFRPSMTPASVNSTTPQGFVFPNPYAGPPIMFPQNAYYPVMVPQPQLVSQFPDQDKERKNWEENGGSPHQTPVQNANDNQN